MAEKTEVTFVLNAKRRKNVYKVKCGIEGDKRPLFKGEIPIDLEALLEWLDIKMEEYVSNRLEKKLFGDEDDPLPSSITIKYMISTEK